MSPELRLEATAQHPEYQPVSEWRTELLEAVQSSKQRRQTYILANTASGWLVDEIIRPAPRSSTPHRKHR